MRRLILLILLTAFLAATPAIAQQQSPSAVEQALGSKLMQEIQAGINCSASSITVQADLAKAQARIKELEKPALSDKP
jgi:hypothetical protein